MTRVVKIEKNGGPEVLQIKDVNIKDPRPDQVLIKQKAIGLNYIDTYHRAGSYPLPLPTGIGLEAAGVIEKIGSKVKDLSVGDTVAYAGVPIGAYAEKRVYPADKLVKLSWLTAASNSAPISKPVIEEFFSDCTAFHKLGNIDDISTNESNASVLLLIVIQLITRFMMSFEKYSGSS